MALQGARRRETLAERQQRRRLVQESLEHLMEEEPVVFQSPVAKKISNESAHTMSKVAAVLNHDEDVRVRIENRVPIIPLRDFLSEDSQSSPDLETLLNEAQIISDTS